MVAERDLNSLNERLLKVVKQIPYRITNQLHISVIPGVQRMVRCMAVARMVRKYVLAGSAEQKNVSYISFTVESYK